MRRLAGWLRSQGHDALFSDELGTDPGDQALLEYAARENRVLVTIDMDFGELIFVHRVPIRGWCVCRTSLWRVRQLVPEEKFNQWASGCKPAGV